MRSLTSLAALLLISVTTFAADLGDPAGNLVITSWVKGAPVDLAAASKDRIVVVEFWATWCGPCKMSIPHLSAMQKRFADKVTFIGVSDEKVETVKPFVENVGNEMAYTVAVDDERKTNKQFMEAYNINGIPHAFVVKDGKVMWHGHPMGGLEETLDAMLAGKFDLEAAKVAARKEADAQEKAAALNSKFSDYFRRVSEPGKEKEASALGEELLTSAADLPQMLNQFAWTILTSSSVKSRDLGLALRAAKAAFDGTEGKDAAIADTYSRALFDNGRVKDAIELERKAIAMCKDSQMKSELEESLKTYLAAEASAK